MRCSDSLSPIPSHFVILRLTVPPSHPVYLLPTVPGAAPWAWGLRRRYQFPLLVQQGGDGRVSQVPGEPSCACHVLRPRRDLAPCHSGVLVLPSTVTNVSAPACIVSRGSINGLLTGCERFAAWITPRRRITRFRLLAGLAGRDWLPAGFLRKVSALLPYITSPSPKLRLALSVTPKVQSPC